jgi:hypothetical protein
MLKVSLFFVILLGATTNCWSVAEELANIHFQVGQIYDLKDDYFTFRLSIGGYDARFNVGTFLQWENLTLDRVEETIVLNSSLYGPAFDDFCTLLTDGDNMHVEKWVEKFSWASGTTTASGLRTHYFEQALFGNQTGCVNGVDLQGKYIESIALTIEDFESVFDPREDNVGTTLNISLVFSGRPLFPNELDLAVVGNLGGTGHYYATQNSTRMYFTAMNGSRWATLEFMIDWNTAVVGDQIAYVREFGTHNIRELITDGDDGYFRLGFDQVSSSYSKSSFFEGQPGCFNDVDLKGNYVQDISLVLDEGTKYEVWATGDERFTIVPKFVFSGNLGDGPTVCPECAECKCECESNHGLPKHNNIATAAEILVLLLTGWAAF